MKYTILKAIFFAGALLGTLHAFADPDGKEDPRKRRNGIAKQAYAPDWNLKGHVKQYTFENKDNDYQWHKIVISFGPDGRALQLLDYLRTEEDSPKLVATTRYYYDAGGRDTAIRTIDTGGKLTKRIANYYDARGNEVKTLTYDDHNSIIARTTYTFTPAGLLQSFTDSTTSVLSVFTYKDSLLESVKWWYLDAPKAITTFRLAYNSAGRQTAETEQMDGKVSTTKKFVYDARNNLTEKSVFDEKGGLMWQYKYRYDAAGAEIESSSYCVARKETEVTVTTGESYDAQGNLTRQTHTTTGGETFGMPREDVYTYEYY